MTTMTTQAPRQTTPRGIHRCAKHPDLIQYREVGQAFTAVDRAFERTGKRLNVYECEHCHYYHLSMKGENIGPQVRSLLVHSTETPGEPAPVRDMPPSSAVRRVEMALSNLGDVVVTKDVATHAHVSRDRTTRILRDLGWHRTGQTRATRWHRPNANTHGDTPNVPESPSALPSERVPLGKIADLTIDQLHRAAEAFGVSIEVEVSIWDRRK